VIGKLFRATEFVSAENSTSAVKILRRGPTADANPRTKKEHDGR